MAPRFVGRAAEFARLTAALAQPPALILVEGEAGIGKSRLVHEALATTKARWWLAVCPPFRDALTLGPIVDAARQCRAERSAGLAGVTLSALAGALRPLFPEWADELPPAPGPIADAGAARHRLMRALAELLDAFGVDLLVVEDIHWADEATLDFLLFLISRRPQRVSLLLTYRREDLPSDSLVLRLSSRTPPGVGQTRISLGVLGVASTAELVSSMLDGQQLAGDLVSFLHERTEGVPLAIEESVRLLRERADLVRRGDEWLRRTSGDFEVPSTIRDAVAERAARLSRSARRVLQAAAVLSEPASLATIREVSGLPAGQARAAVDDTVRSGLLGEDDRGAIAFRHVLASRAVYDGLAAPDLRALHRRAGLVLEAVQPPPLARLARHFRAAGDTDRWWRYGEQAADLALASGDHATSVALLHELLTDTGLHAGAVVRMAQKMPLYAFTGYLGRSDLVKTLRAVLDGELLTVRDRARLRHQLGRMLMHAGEYAAGAAELERAIPHLDEPLAVAQALLALGQPSGTPWPAAAHRRWLGRAEEITAAVPAYERLNLLIDRATALLQMGDPAGWALSEELGPDSPPLQFARGSLNLGDAAVRWGRYGDARRWLHAALATAEQHRYGRLRDMILGTLVHLDWHTGTWEAARLAERAADLADLVEEPVVHLEALLVGGLISAVSGRPEAQATLRRVIDEANQRGMADLPLEPSAALAQLRLSAGDAAGALAVTAGPVRMIAHKRIWLWGADLLPVHLAALQAAGDPAAARRLLAAFARGLRELGGRAPVAVASLATCRALLAPTGRAWAAAARTWQALPRPYGALLAAEQEARCLLAAGERDAGLARLISVHDGLRALGAVADADRVAHTLPARTWRGGRRGYGDQLSPRELEVVRLMLTGLSNPGIARALSRSPKTVAAQLKSAMRKHNVSSRTALAVSAMKAGITPADR